MAGGELPLALGRFRIDGRLGRGAMGDVLLAHDPSGGRRVAIKTLDLRAEAGGEDPAELRGRFKREAAALLELRHPGIVTAFEAGEDDDTGLAWIAMEHVGGSSLEAHVVLPSLLPPPLALLVVARVADALGHAHRHGVVHRDVKPANVLLDLAADRVKLADFGLAALAGGARTRTGVMLGTPAYMAPEQLAGQRPDARADIYSLGVVLFQLLAGELPHRADSLGALMRAVASVDAPDVRERRPDLPEIVADVVALALIKAPEHRIRDAAAWADDLRAVAAQAEPAARAGLSPRAAESPPGSL